MKFNIATTEGVKEVDGEPIDILGHKCFIREVFDLFFVTELSTGMGVRESRDMHHSAEEAIARAKELFETHSEMEWKKKALGNLRYAGIAYPVN